MNKKNTKNLFGKFDFFQPKKSVQESLMAFGFECGDGWYNLNWKLCEKIEKEIKSFKNDDLKNYQKYPFEVVQVKQKFGGLRFYTNWGTDKIYELINEAEEKSYTVCESCGEVGRVRDGGWISTLCDKCVKNK